MRRLRSMWSGKFRVWCMTHGHQFRLFGLVLVLLMLFLLAGYLDRRDMERETTSHKLRADALQRDQDVMRQLPKTVFILEAATTDELMAKMARIAGELDAQRYELRKK